VALLLGQPLLLTGEPGTGKTQLAFHLSNQFGWGDPFLFEAKSTSTYRDLFYTYDALGRFHAKDIEGLSRDAKDYIEYNALGRAILRTRERDEVKQYLRNDDEHDGPAPSVVLIDEIDKAPRDFPNDILREIEQLYFKVPEIDLKPIKVDRTFRPVVVITSNSEKNLPPAFLRRCTFYYIPPPSDEKLLKILENRVGAMTAGDSFYQEAIEFYNVLRNAGLEKKPGTAELIAWVAWLRRQKLAKVRDSEQQATLKTGLAILIKNEDDTRKALVSLNAWLK
jgi:MoxR-like ATPase